MQFVQRVDKGVLAQGEHPGASGSFRLWRTSCPAAPRETRRFVTTALHLIDTTGPGGAETVFLDVAAGMAKRGFDPVPVVAGPGWVWDTAVARGLEPVGLGPKGRFSIGFVRELARLARHRKATLIHAHLLGAAVYGGLAGRLAGIPVLATFHGLTDFPAGDRFRSVRHATLRHTVDRIALVSDSLRTEVLARTGYPADRAEVIHNGIDLSRYHPGRDHVLRNRLGIGPDEWVIGALGNVRPAKAYQVLIQAASRLEQLSRPWRVVIVGDTTGPTWPPLVELVRSLGLDDRVLFAGFEDDVPAALRGFDLCAVSSRSEGFSLATVQALATGLPIVATRSGGPEEILEGSGAGLLVPPDDPAALAAALIALSNDPVRCAAMAGHGPPHAQARFSLETMLDKYQELYRAL